MNIASRIILALATAAPVLTASGVDDPLASPRPLVSRTDDRLASARASVDRDRIALTDRLTLALTLDTPPGEDGSLPPLPSIGEKLGGWRVVSVAPRELRRSAAGGMARGADVVLEPFLPGEYEIPALEFRVKDERGSPGRTLRTAPLKVRVESLLDDSAASKTIGAERGIIDSTATNDHPWTIIGAAGGVLALAAAGAVVIARRRRRAPEPLPDAWKIARLELERTLSRHDWTGADAARALDRAAAVLAGWIAEHPTHEGGPSAAAGRTLEREVEEIRFCGTEPEPRVARHLGEDVMRITSAPPPSSSPSPAPISAGGGA